MVTSLSLDISQNNTSKNTSYQFPVQQLLLFAHKPQIRPIQENQVISTNENQFHRGRPIPLPPLFGIHVLIDKSID